MVAVDLERVSWLTLADAYVVLDRVGAEPEVVTDGREVAVRRGCLAPLDGVMPGTEQYQRIRASVIDDLRERRNRPGGYWIAKDDPLAAHEAVTGSARVAVVDPYALLDWPGALQALHTDGPQDLLQRLRRAEENPSVTDPPDDATAAIIDLR